MVMKIGELSERTGVPTRMLRYYEEQGLLASKRGGNGYRYYDDDAIERVSEVRALIQSGLSSRLAKIVLDAHPDDPARAAVCSAEFATMLADELAGLEARIACLSRSRDTVLRFLESSPYASLVSDPPALA